jgi:hypothetical protein
MYAYLPMSLLIQAEHVGLPAGKELILWGAEEFAPIPQESVTALSVRRDEQISFVFAWTNRSRA